MKIVNIVTTQNVTIEYELASVTMRIVAWMLDVFLLAGTILACNIVLGFQQDGLAGYVAWLLYILTACYTLIAETVLGGQTIGKRLVGIKVVKMNGEIPSFSDNFLRWLLRFIDIILSFGTLAFTLINITEKAQRLGNLATDTVVIRKRSSLGFSLQNILNITAVNNYTPLYPEVRRLSEQDMIVIKTTLLRTEKYRNKAHYNARTALVLRLSEVLSLDYKNIANHELFLKTLLMDYIVLTR